MSTTLHVERRENGVVQLEIDAPPVNALGSETLALLLAELDTIENDMSVRAVVLTGRNGKFCAGADLRDMEGDGAAKARLTDNFSRLLPMLERLRVPVIAAIDGISAGGGLELALVCDIRIASTRAGFIGAAVNMGLMASSYRLPRLIGIAAAKAMLLTGLRTDPETALRYGLVTQVCAPADLLPQALALADRIATRAPLSVEATKRMIDKALDLDPEAGEAAFAAELPALFASADHAEAVARFNRKETPTFIRG